MPAFRALLINIAASADWSNLMGKHFVIPIIDPRNPHCGGALPAYFFPRDVDTHMGEEVADIFKVAECQQCGEPVNIHVRSMDNPLDQILFQIPSSSIKTMLGRTRRRVVKLGSTHLSTAFTYPDSLYTSAQTSIFLTDKRYAEDPEPDPSKKRKSCYLRKC